MKKAKDVLREANGGIIGLSESLKVYEGYDGTIPAADIWDDHTVQLPASEKIKLAEIMIARWEEYKAAVRAKEADRGK